MSGLVERRIAFPELLIDGRPSRRAIADLIRAMVGARRGVSLFSVETWICGFFARLGLGREAVVELIDSTIRDLTAAGDLGRGRARGEAVLFALPERRIRMPDGALIALGDHGLAIRPQGDPERLFPETEGEATHSIMDLLNPEAFAAVRLGGTLPAAGRWSGPQEMPEALRLALILCGSFRTDDLSWSLSAENAAFLNDWLPSPPPRLSEEPAPDPEQAAAIQAAAQARLLVEAGPGSGKTYVACARVAALIRAGAAPSRILLLSFTRGAVAELRARIERRLSEISGVGALRLATFDSYAAQIASAWDEFSGGGYDAGIRAATRLLKAAHPALRAEIRDFEHLLIDEAQDLVGDRKAFCQALIALLHPSCGVTVFGDPAQAVYGYQERDAARSSETLIEALAREGAFQPLPLRQDHRSQKPEVARKLGEARDLLRRGSGPTEARALYFAVREKIREAAVEDGLRNWAAHPSLSRGLILTRSRQALLQAAEQMQAQGRRFRLRRPDRPLRLDPRIGGLLGGLPAAALISERSFFELWEEARFGPQEEAESLWRLLLDLEGSERRELSLGRLAEALTEPVSELLIDHEGSSGPLLSTIHAVKGREAEVVSQFEF